MHARVVLERLGDVAKEDGSDDAATAPHQSDAGVVERPAVLLGGLAHEHEALGVRDDLGRVQGLLEVVNELLLVALELLDLRSAEHLGRRDALVPDGRQASREDGLANERDRHAKVKGVDGSPLARALLSSGIENLLDQGLAIVVVETQDISGDLDQE